MPPPAATDAVGAVVLLPEDDVQTRREKLARIVLDEMYQFVGLLDPDGRTLEINRAALTGAGVRLEDIRGKPFWAARWFQVSRETVLQQQDFVRRARAGEFIRCDLEVYGRSEGEDTIIVDFSLMPVRNTAGAVVFLLAEGRNITAKKQAEAEVARKNAELQRLLDRITQLDQVKSDMFANVSHELRTPLTLILGPVEELLQDASRLTGRQRELLQVVLRSAHALGKHVDDLLDLARVDSGKAQLAAVPMDLAAVVRACAEPFHAIAPGRAVSYHVDVPATMPALADAEMIERVVLNLLSNAFKFTPAGGRIRCRLEALDGGRALITVQDSGPGVAMGHEAAIFERFWQAQHGTTRRHGGTGLGLAIAREFVQLHGGTISVSRAPGGGALFQVELPLGDAPATNLTTQPAVDAASSVLAELQLVDEPGAPAPLPDDERASILVVEDNPAMRRFVIEALSAEFRVAAVGEGESALAHMSATPPDLVITDLMLTGLGGDLLVQAMRDMSTLAETPVLVLSAKGDAALRSRLLAESVQDYLTKPFSPQELRARVHNLMTMKLARQALQTALDTQACDLAQLTRSLIAQQQALQSSERRWWAIHEHSPVGIVLVAEDGVVGSANPAFRRLVGRTAEELARCTLDELTPRDDRPAMRERVAGLLAGQLQDYRLQRRFSRIDGSVAWANTSVAVIPASDHRAPTVMLVTEDITEQKVAEQSLAAARHELARVTRVSSLGELAASIAHEVNQPLAAIAANAHACLRWLDADPPDLTEARMAARRIARDASRAGEVITRIRHFLRRGEPVRAILDLRVVVEEVLMILRPEAQHQGVRIRLDPGVGPWATEGDAVQLQQVVLNLVINAFESIARAGRREGCVTVRVGRCDERTLQIEVHDNGAGLDDTDATRLFEAFYTRKQQGLGMGLAIAHSIVQSHGGRLWATPHPVSGAVFHFTLPIA